MNREISSPKNHPHKNLLSDLNEGLVTRSMLHNFCAFSAFVYELEPHNYREALEEPEWIMAMQEALNQFKRNQVWTLVERTK